MCERTLTDFRIDKRVKKIKDKTNMLTKIPQKKKVIGNKTSIEITEHRVHDGENKQQRYKISRENCLVTRDLRDSTLFS